MKTLVLGGAGMLGHRIVETFHLAGLPVECTFRREPPELPPFFDQVVVHRGVNALDHERVRALLDESRPDVLVNCVGVIKQRDEAKAAIPSIATNALLPHLLAEWVDEWGGRLIHFSTDCVFSGRKGDYGVEDSSDAEDLYGKTKYLGEVARSGALTLRTSIIGRELSNHGSLVDWFFSQNGGKVRGFTNAVYTGMTTQTMARLVMHIAFRHPEVHGLHHAVSAKIDKFSLLKLIRDKAGLDIEIEPYEGFHCDRSMLPSGLEEQVGFVVPTWEEQIQEMVRGRGAERAEPAPTQVA
jgi:dTDP-4-dehydrorhamnose reductase